MEENRKLAGYVTLDGKTYGPQDVIPDDVASRIKNPKAWASDSGDAADDVPAVAGTSDGRRLRTTVTVGGRSYGPTDFIPDDVASQIRNPKAWEDGGGAAKAPQPKEDLDNGGALPPGSTTVTNDSGEPEPVIKPEESGAGEPPDDKPRKAGSKRS